MAEFEEHDKNVVSKSESALIVNFVHANFHGEISLDDIAQNTGINKYNVSRFFSRALQINFKAYINSLRIQEAQNRVFKEITGITPMEYRKRNSVPLPVEEIQKSSVLFYRQIGDESQELITKNKVMLLPF